MNFLGNITLPLADGFILTGALYDGPGDGACFFHCIVGFFINYYESSKVPDDFFFPLDSTELRLYVCEKLLEMKDEQIPGFFQTPASYFAKEYSLFAKNRKSLHSGTWNNEMTQNGHNPQEHPLKVDDFNDYVAWMSDSKTQVDKMMVAFTAHLLQINLKVFTRSVSEVSETSEDANVSRLISMGFSKNQAEQELAKVNGNLERALETILSSPQSQHSEHSHEGQQQIWREQPYSNMLGGITVNLINDGAHFRLLYPDRELENESGGDAAQSFSGNYLPNDDEEFSRLLAQVANKAEVFEQELQNSSDAAVFEHEPQMISKDEFIALCDKQLQHLTVLPQFSDVNVVLTKDNLESLMKFLSKRFTIPSLDSNYRVVVFYMNDDSKVSYQSSSKHECSRREKKMAFFDELFSNISGKVVTSVRLERL
jgi:hypothetical protein